MLPRKTKQGSQDVLPESRRQTRSSVKNETRGESKEQSAKGKTRSLIQKPERSKSKRELGKDAGEAGKQSAGGGAKEVCEGQPDLSAVLRDAFEEMLRWLDSDKVNDMVRIFLKDGSSETSFGVLKPSGWMPQSKKATETARIEDLDGKVHSVQTILNKHSKSLRAQEVRVSRWVLQTGTSVDGNPTTWASLQQDAKPLWQQKPDERQSKDIADAQRQDALRTQLYHRIFPVWQEVADGARAGKAPWTTGLSTDALTFFCEWLMFDMPDVGKARSFLQMSEAQIRSELDDNADTYTRKEDGELWLRSAQTAGQSKRLQLFRKRWRDFQPSES